MSVVLSGSVSSSRVRSSQASPRGHRSSNYVCQFYQETVNHTVNFRLLLFPFAEPF